MIIRLAPALKRDFKAKLAFEGKTAQETLEHLIMGYMLRQDLGQERIYEA